MTTDMTNTKLWDMIPNEYTINPVTGLKDLKITHGDSSLFTSGPEMMRALYLLTSGARSDLCLKW